MSAIEEEILIYDELRFYRNLSFQIFKQVISENSKLITQLLYKIDYTMFHT